MKEVDRVTQYRGATTIVELNYNSVFKGHSKMEGLRSSLKLHCLRVTYWDALRLLIPFNYLGIKISKVSYNTVPENIKLCKMRKQIFGV